MYRKLRIALATLFFCSLTLMLLDFTGTLHHWLSWTARVQFLPALLALNVGVVVVLAALTLLLGRVYCSVVCPLGVLQDIIWITGRRPRQVFTRAKNWLRYGVLALFTVLIVAGCTQIAALIAPYSAFARMTATLFQPLYKLANNALALGAERIDSYAFYHTDVLWHGGAALAVSVATLLVIAVLARRGGRTWCNTICPVGTVLGFLARFAWLRPHIDTAKCTGCGQCARQCKASCIDPKTHRIDLSRCVACMDCLNACRQGTISYSHAPAEPAAPATAADGGRRAFLVGALTATAAATLAQKKRAVDGGLAAIEDKVAPQRQTPILPPGAGTAAHFAQHCTACQLCVSECPGGVLRPSDDLATLMQPRAGFEHGWCRPECTRCANVCPTGALKPLTPEVKASTQIGHAVWIRKNCLPATQGTHCGNCARHCPAGAITMVPLRKDDADAPLVPAINAARCIGCGACENLCPARPFSAIVVEGHEQQRQR